MSFRLGLLAVLLLGPVPVLIALVLAWGVAGWLGLIVLTVPAIVWSYLIGGFLGRRVQG